MPHTKESPDSPLYYVLSTLFVTSLLLANITAGKMANLFGLTLPAAVVFFPITYILGDVLTEARVLRAVEDAEREGPEREEGARQSEASAHRVSTDDETLRSEPDIFSPTERQEFRALVKQFQRTDFSYPYSDDPRARRDGEKQVAEAKAAFDRFAYDCFRTPAAVGRCCVDQVDTGIQGCLYGGNRLAVINVAVCGAAHRPGAQGNNRYF